MAKKAALILISIVLFLYMVAGPVEEDYESTRYDSLQHKKNENKIIGSGVSGLEEEKNDPVVLKIPESEVNGGDSSMLVGNSGAEGASTASGDGGPAENYNNERENDSQDFNRHGQDGEMYGSEVGGGSADGFHYKESHASTDFDPNSYHYKDSAVSEDGNTLRFRDSASVDQESEFGSNFGKGFGKSGDGGEGNFNRNNESNDFSFHRSNDWDEAGNGAGNLEHFDDSQDAFRFNNPSGDFGENSNVGSITNAGTHAKTNAITDNSEDNILGNGRYDGAETSQKKKLAGNQDTIGVEGGKPMENMRNSGDSFSAIGSENNSTKSSNLGSDEQNKILLVAKQGSNNDRDFAGKTENMLSNPPNESEMQSEMKFNTTVSVESVSGYIRGNTNVTKNISGQQRDRNSLGETNSPTGDGNERARNESNKGKSGGLRGYPAKRDMNKELLDSEIALSHSIGNHSFGNEEKSSHVDNNSSAGNDPIKTYESSLQSNIPAINNTVFVPQSNSSLSKLKNKTKSEHDSSLNKIQGNTVVDIDNRYPAKGSGHELNINTSEDTGAGKIKGVNSVDAVNEIGNSESNKESETLTYDSRQIQGSGDSNSIQHQTLEIPQSDQINDGNVREKSPIESSPSLVGNSDATPDLDQKLQNSKLLLDGEDNTAQESGIEGESTVDFNSENRGRDTAEASMQKFADSVLAASDVESKRLFATDQSNQKSVASNYEVRTKEQVLISSQQDDKSGSTHGVEVVHSKNSSVADGVATEEVSNPALDSSTGSEMTVNKSNFVNNADISDESSLTETIDNEMDAKVTPESHQGIAGAEVSNVQDESLTNTTLNKTSLQINRNSTKIGSAILSNATAGSNENRYIQQVENTISDGVGKPDAIVDDTRLSSKTPSNGIITKKDSVIKKGSGSQAAGNVTKEEIGIEGGNIIPDVTNVASDQKLLEASEENSMTSKREVQADDEAQQGLPQPSNQSPDNGTKAESNVEGISNVRNDDSGRSYSGKESITNERSIGGGDVITDTSKGSANLSAMLQDMKDPPEIVKLNISLVETKGSNENPLAYETGGNEISPKTQVENSSVLSEKAKSTLVGNDERSSIATSDAASSKGAEEASATKKSSKDTAATVSAIEISGNNIDTENVDDIGNKISEASFSEVGEQQTPLSMERRAGGDPVESDNDSAQGGTNNDSISNGQASV